MASSATPQPHATPAAAPAAAAAASAAATATAANGAGASVSGSTGGASAAALGVTLQSSAVQLSFPLPKQMGARPLSPAQHAHMQIRPLTAPQGLVKLAAELTASNVGLRASAEASGLLRDAVKNCKKQIALRKLHATALRNSCERLHADCLAVELKCRAVSADLQSLSLIATDLTREEQRLKAAKATREFEIQQIGSEIARESAAISKLNELSAKMKAELSRLTKERDHYQRESALAERTAERLRASVHEKAASTKRMFAAFDVSEHDLGVAAATAAGGNVTHALIPVDRDVPAFLR